MTFTYILKQTKTECLSNKTYPNTGQLAWQYFAHHVKTLTFTKANATATAYAGGSAISLPVHSYRLAKIHPTSNVQNLALSRNCSFVVPQFIVLQHYSYKGAQKYNSLYLLQF